MIADLVTITVTHQNNDSLETKSGRHLPQLPLGVSGGWRLQLQGVGESWGRGSRASDTTGKGFRSEVARGSGCTQGRGGRVCGQAENRGVADGGGGFREVLGVSKVWARRGGARLGSSPGQG